jgi:hypothetical protein
MPPRKNFSATSELPDKIEEIERQMQVWRAEAAQLGRSIEDFAIVLRDHACQLSFRGDLIIFEDDSTSSAEPLVVLNLARVRNVVCNLKALNAERKQFQSQRKKCVRRAHA